MPLVLSLVAVVGIARGLYVRFAYANEGPQLTGQALDFSLREVALARGLDHETRHFPLPDAIRVGPWVQSIGANVAVADVNGDGFMDIFVGSLVPGEKNRLFINDGHGQFRDRADEYGLADLNHETVSIRGVFFDANDDGKPDLLLVTNACPKLFLQSPNGKFVVKETEFPASACGVNEAVALTDIDGDGRVDLVLGGIPFDFRTFRVLPTDVVNARNGTELSVMLNRAPGVFRFAPGRLDAKGKYFFHSLGVGDLRGTGRPDIWAAADFTDSKVFLRNDRGYELVNPPFTTSRSGMNSEVLYLEGEERPFVFVSHAYRIGYAVGGNNLWRYDGHDFVDESRKRGVDRCGWAWGGRAVDLNNDGLLDLAVANGFISGDPGRDYWFAYGTLISSIQAVTRSFEFWPPMKDRDFSGHERDCLFLNRGDHFENVAEIAGFDAPKLDGRGVAVIDADNSGRQSLLVANQNGRLMYYEVSPDPRRNWIGFRLRGRPGNRDAIGSRVIIRAGGKTFRRENYTLNTFAAQSDPRVHFGLGEISTVEEVEIRWPEGKLQKIGPLRAGRYYEIEEGRDAIANDT